MDVSTSPLTSLVLGVNEKLIPLCNLRLMSSSEVIFADSHARVTSFSLCKQMTNGNFAGPTGSVLSLDAFRHSSGRGLLACVGLDSYLRLYDMKNRKSVGKIYCESKLGSVLIVEAPSLSKDLSPKAKRKAIQTATQKDEDASDAVWARMPKVDSHGSRPKRRRLSIPSQP